MAAWVRDFRDWLPRGQLLDSEIWAARHRAISSILWLHVVGVPAFALFRGYSLTHALAESAPLAAAAVAASWRDFGRPLRTLAATFGLMSSSAVLVHLSGGVIETHFHFFVMVPLVVLYQDWWPFLLAILYVLIHHGLMGALYPDSVYNHYAAINQPWEWAAIHAAFVSAASAVCLVTWRMNENARAETERARARVAILAEASDVLASSLDLDLERTLASLTGLVVPSLAPACAIHLCETPQRPSGREAGPDLRRVAFRATEPFERSLSGQSFDELQRSTEEVARLGEVAEVPIGDQAVATLVPLVVRAEVLGVLSIVSPADDPHEIALAVELARRVSAAVENARLYARERSVAETLQRSLLPERFPAIPGIEVAARYAPGGPGVEVGGDWYDVFELPNGNVAIAMGDVVGRGIPAASLMGQLRNALRAYAGEGHEPASVLSRLHRLVHEHDPDHLATLVYGELDPANGELRVANAGHPAPMIASTEGVSVADTGSGVPLGAVVHAQFSEAVVPVPVGGRVVMFTDGLVEDRTLTLDEGTRRVREAVSSAPDDLEAFCDHVVAAATKDRVVDDDVALLVVRLTPLPDPFVLEMPNEPRALVTVRAALRRWLSQLDSSEDETYEVLVAAGEACANAIEHASGPGTGGFVVEARREEGRVCICVRDGGKWRPKRAGPGGRGLQVMQAFMDEVEVDRSEGGTEVRMYRELGLARAKR